MQHTSDFCSFTQLFTDYRERFVRFAYSYLRDRSVAEDIVIDAFVYYWENRKTLATDRNIPGYVLTTIKHKCLNHLQHLQVKQAYAEQTQEQADWEVNLRISTLEAFDPYELFTKEIQDIIDHTLSELPDQTRKIFILSRYENKSHKEIADLLNMTTKGVEYHIAKALTQLKKSLIDYIAIIAFFL